jgi:6-phosphogluconolactonase (cycloisomerase 2 family)
MLPPATQPISGRALSGSIKPHQEISAVPDTFAGFSRASEIEISPDGRLAYQQPRRQFYWLATEVDQ